MFWNIGHKSDACIIHGPKYLPPSHRKKMNQFNALHVNELNKLPRKCNIQPTPDNFKSRTSPLKTNPAVPATMGRLNHHSIDIGEIKVPPS